MTENVSFVGSCPGDPELLMLKTVDGLLADISTLLAKNVGDPARRLTRTTIAMLAGRRRIGVPKISVLVLCGAVMANGA